MPAPRSAPADLVTEQLPCLRRYARALTGRAISGDAYVRMVLETLVQDGVGVLGQDADRGTLFRLFHRIYAGGHLELEDEGPVPETMGPGALLRTLPCERREALLLTAVEGFSADEAAWILGLPLDEVERQIHLARQAFRDRLRSGVLMLEDDMAIRIPQAGEMPPRAAPPPVDHPASGAGAGLH
ncbi:sigma factor-like helix-turn-helix DNA-binding protein [Nitrospirillum sp. BR 11163]|uniref:sigma factor-like helix-turn-helix DNA-binding protein n=1 Tax=Nitrospirillum sp. BR 11163 TaxID=3104323 RepID=UPI002AFDF993|nr:sigma factor-like helix-turn-helix DNA-binding protein [Nitrospirillum sp. BR 11163]MEA1673552.1 sigma factor-like helix-turn-helix DNA-binding protein [Nitrospirillum sp. BR 11163]